MDYATGVINVTFNAAPMATNLLQILYRRKLHRLHDAKITVQKSDGTTEEVTIGELAAAIGQA